MLSNIDYLGAPKFKYVFVGDYSELKGYTAAEAVQKLGGTLIGDDRVSAIIFRPRHVYPANARGMLQVIQKVETQNSDLQAKRLLSDTSLSDDEKNDLANDRDIEGWAWENYSRFYTHYCEFVQQFRCNRQYSARPLMSIVDSDYSPLGFAQKIKDDKCNKILEICHAPVDYDSFFAVASLNFGTRVFLTENKQIKDLGGRYLIEFDQPFSELIPDIGEAEDAPCQVDLK